MNKKQIETTKKIIEEMYQESKEGKEFKNAFHTFKQKWYEEKNKEKNESK